MRNSFAGKRTHRQPTIAITTILIMRLPCFPGRPCCLIRRTVANFKCSKYIYVSLKKPVSLDLFEKLDVFSTKSGANTPLSPRNLMNVSKQLLCYKMYA